MKPPSKGHAQSSEWCFLTVRGKHTRYDQSYTLNYKMKSTEEMDSLMDYVCFWLRARTKFSVFFYGNQIVKRGDTPKKLNMKRKAHLNMLTAPKTLGWDGRAPRLRLLVQDGNRTIVQFDIRPWRELGKLMDAFCTRKNVARSCFRFLFNDHEIEDHETAESLGIVYFDIINAIKLDD